MVGRGLALASLAFVLFLICIIGATAAGGISSRNHDLVIPFTLVVVAILAAIAGPRVTSPLPTPRTQPQVVILVTLWIFGALLTLVAGADLAANS
jgi:O-antigen ligase